MPAELKDMTTQDVHDIAEETIDFFDDKELNVKQAIMVLAIVRQYLDFHVWKESVRLEGEEE